MASDARSASSRSSVPKSKSSAPGHRGSYILSHKPLDIDGRIFLQQRRCPASGLKNTDLNVISKGKFGPQHSKHAIWHRGTSENPDSRYERVSVLTWEHGGFADCYPSMDEFVDKMKASRELTAEFQAAYKEMILVIEEGKMIFRGAEKSKLNMRLQSVRQTTLTAVKSHEVHLKTGYKVTIKSIYDKKYPGRAARKKMKIAELMINGKLTECVCVPKNKKGEFDLDEVDISGLRLQETIDDGSAIISANQQQRKFDSMVSATTSDLRQWDQNLKLEEEAEFSEADDVRASSGDGASDEEASDGTADSEAPSDDSLHFARSALPLLNTGSGADSVTGNKKRPPLPTARATLPARARTSATSASQGGPAALARTPVKASHGSRSSGSGLGSRSSPQPQPSPSPRSDKTSKFEGKTPEEILEKHKMPEIVADFQAGAEILKMPVMDDLLLDPVAFEAQQQELKKHANNAHKKCVALDIKVKKWQSIPETLRDDYVAQ